MPGTSVNLTHLSDEALIDLCERGEEVALGELYERYGQIAFSLAFRMLRNETLAEDAVQEAFLTVWRNASRFMPERAKASTWLLTIMHRRAVDLVRREERRRTEPLSPSVEAAAASEGTAADVVWLRLQRERVQDALSRLPDEQREALELAYYGGFTQSELAERLGQPLGTIKSRMFAGLARLRELLGDIRIEDERWSPSESTT